MNQIAIRTSETHPIRIDSVAPPDDWGAIGMSLCPGKHQPNGLTGAWQRDLNRDLARIRDWGAIMVVSLIEAHEFKSLRVEPLPDRVTELGMQWRHLPIPDNCPPGPDFAALWDTVGREITELLKSHNRVFLHCMGGLGRTGTVAACLLIEAGLTPIAAICAVRAARPNTIETLTQETYVLNYKPILLPR